MPRTVAEILAHADELASRFQDYEPSEVQGTDVGGTLAALRSAALSHAAAERAVRAAVVVARRAEHSWATVGSLMGATGEAARQRYGDAETSQASPDAEIIARLRRILQEAGFTADEVREFAGLLSFGAVLAQAGHDGLISEIKWTPEKVQAMTEAFRLLGLVPVEGPAQSNLGPEIRVHSSVMVDEHRDANG